MIKLSSITNRKAKVLINPTRKEIREISEINDPVNNVRAVNFILDLTSKKFYVFSPNKSHDEIAESIPTLKKTITGSLVRMDGDKEWIVECLSAFDQNEKVIKQLIKKVYLKEAFHDSLKTHEGVYVEIYVNPSKKELDDASSLFSFGGEDNRAIRFIYDIERNKFYVFSADVFHEAVMHKLGYDKGREGMDELYSGKFPHGAAIKVKHGGAWGKWRIETLKGIAGGLSDYDQSVLAKKEKARNAINGFLNESFHEGYRSTIDGTYGEIYVDPTNEELIALADTNSKKYRSPNFSSVNFVYDEDNDKLYVFPWNEWHEKIIKKLKLKTGYMDTFTGQFYKIGNGPWHISNPKISRYEDQARITRKIENKLRRINEEFSFSVDEFNESYPIYKLSTTQDEDDLTRVMKIARHTKEIRFIANAQNKEFYIFPGELPHFDVADKLGIENIYETKIPIIAGIIKDENDYWKVTNSFNILMAIKSHNSAFMKRIFSSDWSFVQKFVNIKSFLEEAKKKWMEIEKNDFPSSRNMRRVNEELAFSVKEYSGTFPIYKINGPQDEDDLFKAAHHTNAIRFIANAATKEFYIFSSDVPHGVVAHQIGVNIYEPKVPVMAGIIEERNGYWRVVDSFNVFTEMEEHNNAFLKKIISADWSFVQKFVNIKSFVEEVKKQWIEGEND